MPGSDGGRVPQPGAAYAQEGPDEGKPFENRDPSLFPEGTMSQFVTTHFVQQYTTNVQLLSQQKMSRLRASVSTATYTGKQGVPVDQFAATVANRRTTRYPALTPADTQTDRRWVFPADYDWNDLIDSIDKLRMLIDPQSSYVQ